MTQVARSSLPLLASTGRLTAITGLPGTTLRRMAREHPDFPKPIVINDRGDFSWPVLPVLGWLEARAGRPLTA
jgi:hypothetical protein